VTFFFDYLINPILQKQIYIASFLSDRKKIKAGRGGVKKKKERRRDI